MSFYIKQMYVHHIRESKTLIRYQIGKVMALKWWIYLVLTFLLLFH